MVPYGAQRSFLVLALGSFTTSARTEYNLLGHQGTWLVHFSNFVSLCKISFYFFKKKKHLRSYSEPF